MDRVVDKTLLLPFFQKLSERRDFAEIIPISALRRDNLDTLERLISARLPASEFLFSEDQITTASHRFIAAELVREKLTRRLRDELPYALTVEIENFLEDKRLLRIGAVIWVERPGQKAIVIGEKGSILKEIGHQAREDMERIFQRKVYLQTWVKVREGWSNNEHALRHLGYVEQF